MIYISTNLIELIQQYKHAILNTLFFTGLAIYSEMLHFSRYWCIKVNVPANFVVLQGKCSKAIFREKILY